MNQVEFNYNGNISYIQCNSNDKMGNICQKFATKISIDINSVYFLYSGNKINNELTFHQTANIVDKGRNQMNVLVFPFDVSNPNENENNNIIESKEIICPKCGESIKINIEEYKISLYDCKNGHKIKNISLDEFENTQKIDLNKIKCDYCKEKDIIQSYKNKFYKCLNCEKKLCPICKSSHNKQHSIINYEEKNYICDSHNEYYYSYCEKCKKNLCMLCEKSHTNHNIIYFGKIMPNIEEQKIQLEILRENIIKFNNNIQEIINILNKVMQNMNVYYKIKNNMINNIENKNRNYEEIYNLVKNSNNDYILKDINKIINEISINNKFNNIMDLYEKMNYDERDNEITMIYKINKNENSIRIFGSKFVENNKDKCKIIYNDNEYELENEFKLNDIRENQDTIQIKLKGIKNITNMSNMFCLCKSLLSLPDISKIDTSKVTDMSGMFECSSLLSLPDISNWDTSNVSNMCALFHNCSSLLYLPDISKWNTSNVSNMNYMFSGCKSLKFLPDISKWNITNVNKMSKIFDSCNKSLKIPEKFRNN